MKKHYVLLIFMLITGMQFSVAQNFYNKNGTTVTILENGKLTILDTLVNEGEILNFGTLVIGDAVTDYLLNQGELLNEDSLKVAGAWLNQGNYDPGNGIIMFTSTDLNIPQIINHNSQSFSKLVISGGGVKQILADLTVVESLTLTDGIINAQGNHGVHFAPSAVITGGSDKSHINAPVYQQGTGTKLYPIGNGTTYLPVAINGITVNSDIGITLSELQTGQTFNTNSSLEDISDKRYWAVDVASGSLDGTKIVLPVEGGEGLDASKNDRLVVAFTDDLDNDFITLGRAQSSTSSRIESEQSPATGFVTLAIPSENQSIVVFNAISPNEDDAINNFIQIDNLVETDLVSIYNRWGDLVFEMKNYQNDNIERRFNGRSNVGGSKDLPTGTYFYVIKRKAGESVSGYLSLRR